MAINNLVNNHFIQHDDQWLDEQYHQFIKDKKENFCFFELNIKDFQFYNIRYGKAIADEILSITFQALENFVGNCGYVAHSHGDTYHFFMQCPYLRKANEDPDHYIMDAFIIDLADCLFEIDNAIIYKNFYASMGVVLPEDIHGELKDLIDHAHFFRKRCPEIKNRSFCYGIMCQEDYDRFIEVGELTRKLTSYRFEEKFDMYIQPKIDLQSEKIIGGEVLLRLFDNEKEIPLVKFLPLLNESKEIYMVDLMIFKKACKYLADGIANKEVRLPLSFNISNANLDKENFINDYREIMDTYHIPSKYIEFEFLEEISHQRSQMTIKLINQFRKEGLTCSLDDFGTGSSTFKILLNADLSTIKLDRIFFSEELNDKRKNVLKNTCETIHNLGIKVLAEGVEDQAYIDYLKEIGCDYVQGFYYYRPMPVKDFQMLLNEQSK